MSGMLSSDVLGAEFGNQPPMSADVTHAFSRPAGCHKAAKSCQPGKFSQRLPQVNRHPGVKPSRPFLSLLTAGVARMLSVYTNRRAHYEYELLDRFEAGVSLTGSEVKSIRAGGVDFRDAFARLQNGNLELEGLYIPEYTQATYNNHTPRRTRRLLMNRLEIEKIRRSLTQKGLTLVPTKMYLKGGRFKIELALGRGKNLHDKRRAESEKQARREIREA